MRKASDVSSDRGLEISAQLGEAVVTQYVQDGVVCPSSLKKGLFTTFAIDNIDHNPTATTAMAPAFQYSNTPAPTMLVRNVAHLK